MWCGVFILLIENSMYKCTAYILCTLHAQTIQHRMDERICMSSMRILAYVIRDVMFAQPISPIKLRLNRTTKLLLAGSGSLWLQRWMSMAHLLMDCFITLNGKAFWKNLCTRHYTHSIFCALLMLLLWLWP